MTDTIQFHCIPCLSLSLEETTKYSSSSNAIADLIRKELREMAAFLLLSKGKKAVQYAETSPAKGDD